MLEDNLIDNLNGIDYENDELNKYVNLSNKNISELEKISGSIKTKYALNGLSDSNKLVKNILKANEHVLKIIKIRDITDLNLATLYSCMNILTFKSNDIPIFRNLYFTENRILITILNYANQPLIMDSINYDDILGYSTGDLNIKIIKNSDGTLKFKKTLPKLFLFSIIFSIVGILITFMTDKPTLLPIYILFAVTYIIGKLFKLLTLDNIKIIKKDGTIVNLIISSNDYKTDKRFLKNILKKK